MQQKDFLFSDVPPLQPIANRCQRCGGQNLQWCQQAESPHAPAPPAAYKDPPCPEPLKRKSPEEIAEYSDAKLRSCHDLEFSQMSHRQLTVLHFYFILLHLICLTGSQQSYSHGEVEIRSCSVGVDYRAFESVGSRCGIFNNKFESTCRVTLLGAMGGDRSGNRWPRLRRTER